jgi:hypothetical protein
MSSRDAARNTPICAALVLSIAPSVSRGRHVVNLLLVLMVFAIWFLMNHHNLFSLPP